ncbi:hypothetical protein Calag_0882 [Caldisphaera lagunensis DSM 15908]|uniref:Rubrerythrin diiron-binding domain-containing protein n=1 Tax=Caldisphaera lagunensis (strain DSM 15908 / JCM 11604 / ANMR 0165 / IC-154) TaxID=1056495 RepID=L0ABY1_CALLD|nr:hypothetical protein [Caldisphaera lagunensis]AFZ70622.1 hypothetical protein Calag_0882 [Caldisphaera lagunensis DSM 15908]
MSSYKFEDRRRLVSYFKNEAKREINYSDDVRKTSNNSINPIVKLIMEAVSQDSIKHSKIYETMSLIIENPQLITEKESEMVLDDMKRHIENEKESIEELNNLLKDKAIQDDKPLKFLIEMLLRDEKLHHAMLSDLYNILIKNITLTERDIWDQIWKDSMYHGTPGG